MHTGALSGSLDVTRKRQPGRKVVEAVNTDGYGHGVKTAAPAAQEVAGFTVSSVEEAPKLREIKKESRFSSYSISAVCGGRLDRFLHPGMLVPAQDEFPGRGLRLAQG